MPKEIQLESYISLNTCPVSHCPLREAMAEIRSHGLNIEDLELAREIVVKHGLETSYVYNSWGRFVLGGPNPNPLNIVRIFDGDAFHADCYTNVQEEKTWCGRLYAGEITKEGVEFIIHQIWRE